VASVLWFELGDTPLERSLKLKFMRTARPTPSVAYSNSEWVASDAHVYPPELDYSRQRDSFDPIREGERYGLLPKLSLAIWKRVSKDATDIFGRRNEDQALKQFHELAARITARGRRLQPDPGRLTRVGTEINGEGPGTWAADELMPRVPGRQTLVAVEARRWANRAGDASATVAGGSSDRDFGQPGEREIRSVEPAALRR
jgi:hypothetical protein